MTRTLKPKRSDPVSPTHWDSLFAHLGKYLELSSEEKGALQELDIFRSFRKGEMLRFGGNSAPESFLVLRGCIRIFRIKDDVEHTLDFLTEMEGYAPAISEEAAVSHPRAACLEPCTLIVSTPEMEKGIFERFPRFETLCRIVAEKQLARKQSEHETFRILDAEERYLRLIEARPDLSQRVPQRYLAGFLGIRPETLSRIRRRLARGRK